MSTALPPKKPGPGDHVILVDGSSFVFRAYFQSIRQDQRYNYRSDRLPTGAVRVFATKLFQFVREGARGKKATHLAMIFDKSEDSFRKALYPAYKANRSEPPDELVPQFPLMRAVVRAFGYEPVEMAKYEADDLIATYASEAAAAGAEVTIVSADKDLMQLIGPGITLYDPASGEREERLIGEAEVLDYFGVTPDKVVEVQALAGDSTDNIPGAPGIGVKTAAQLITEYGDLESLLARASEIKQPKRRETLTDPDVVEKVRISKTLVTLVRDVPVECPLERLVAHPLDAPKAVAFLKAMEFTTLTKRVADLSGVEFDSVPPDPAYAAAGKGGAVPPAPVTDAASAAPAAVPSADALTPASLAAERLAKLRAMPVKPESFPPSRISPRSTPSSPRQRSAVSSPSIRKPRRLIPCRPISWACRWRSSRVARSMCRSSIARGRTFRFRPRAGADPTWRGACGAEAGAGRSRDAEDRPEP